MAARMNKGQKQMKYILNLFQDMPDGAKEIFLLGRIYTLLEIGNIQTNTINKAIKDCDNSLDKLKAKDEENKDD